MIETPGVDVDGMAVGRGPLREGLVVLSVSDCCNRSAYLGRSLEVLDAVPVDIVVRSNRLPELGRNDKTRAVGGWSSSEEHDTGTSVGERVLT